MPTPHRGHQVPIRYELRVLGHLDSHWSTWFTGLTLTQEADGTTSLCGVVTDQAELHGLIAKVRDLGVTLLSVTPADTTSDHDPQTDTSKTTNTGSHPGFNADPDADPQKPQ
ncbi:MAG TPA: hypothetical protein VIT65_04985 [Microlunatus sp.]